MDNSIRKEDEMMDNSIHKKDGEEWLFSKQ